MFSRSFCRTKSSVINPELGMFKHSNASFNKFVCRYKIWIKTFSKTLSDFVKISDKRNIKNTRKIIKKSKMENKFAKQNLFVIK